MSRACRRTWLAALAAAALLPVSTTGRARAEDATVEPAAECAADATETPSGEEVAEPGVSEGCDGVLRSGIEEHVTVCAPRPEFETQAPERDAYAAGRLANLSLAFATVPGVSGVRRSQNALEPVIRGLGWERVQTQINGMPLYGACSGRMDPPATILNADAVNEAVVVKGLASVTLGPGGSGGRLVVSTDGQPAAHPAGGEGTLTPWVRMAWDESREGYSGGAGLQGGNGRFDFSASVQALNADDYSSAGGIVVPAHQEESGGHANLGVQLTRAQRLTFDAMLRKGEDTDYPSLPMDNDWDRDRVYSMAWKVLPQNAGRLVTVETRAGLEQVDHQMSNRDKSNYAMVQSESRSRADTTSAGVLVRGTFAGNAPFTAGLDALDLGRDAERDMTMTSTGMTTHDHLWPDATQRTLGAFFEQTLQPGEGWRVRMGGRYDRVESDARAADDPSLGGRTVRENYVFFYGPEAAEVAANEDLLSANVTVSRDLNGTVSLEGGIGLVSRSAGITERYYSFATAPGGYLVGNPALDAERKYEASLGADVRGRKASGAVSVFYYDFGDYIHQYILTRADVNGDGRTDIIRGFENVPASFIGAEAEMTLQAGGGVTIPLGVMYVRAENDADGTPLAEIPPLEGRAAVRWTIPGGSGVRLEAGGRFVAEQSRIDPSFGENETPGFSVWHLRGRWGFMQGAYVEAGIENLFDKDYNEHLTREAALATEDLAAGDEIPQPGRSFFAALRMEF